MIRDIYKFCCLAVFVLFIGCQSKGTIKDIPAYEVTFRVLPKSLPDSATVYITGNNSLLGNFDPAVVPMNNEPDGSWSKSIHFPPGLIVEYKFDLGSPLSEAVGTDSLPLGSMNFTVEKDTQIVVKVVNWKDAILSPEEKLRPCYLAEKYFQRTVYTHERYVADSTLYYYQKAAELFQQEANWERLVRCYYRMRVAFPKPARMPYLNRALAISLNHLGENHLETAEVFSHFADHYRVLDDYDRALEYANRALSIRLGVYEDEYWSYLSLAAIYRKLENFDKAIENYEKALAIRIKFRGPTHQDVGNIYMWLGTIYSEKGDFIKAIAYFGKSKKIRDYYYIEISVTSHMTYEELGKVYLLTGEYKRAEDHFQKSLAVRKKMYHEYHGHIANAQMRLAEAKYGQGEYENALAHLQQALQVSVPVFVNSDTHANPSTEGVGFVRRKLIETLAQKGKILQEIAATAEPIPNTQLQSHTKNLETALNCYEAALKLFWKWLGGFLSGNAKLFLEAQMVETVEQAIQTTLKLHELTNEVVYKEKAWFFCEFAKSAMLRFSVQESEAKTFAGIEPDILQQEAAIKDALASTETLLDRERRKKERDENKIGKLETEYYGLKSQHGFLLADFEKRYPRYFELKYKLPSPNVIELQELLDEKTALIEYFIGESTVYIFVVTEDEFEIISFPRGESFTTGLTTYVNAIKQVVDQKAYLESSVQLYKLLLQPIKRQIASKERLVIIPDGLLYYVPFEALLTKDAPHDNVDFTNLDYLIKSFEISYHYSATLYQKAVTGQAKPRSADQLMAFAPVFSKRNDNGYILAANANVFDDLAESEKLTFVTRDGSRFQELKHSESEVQTVVKLFERNNKSSIAYFHDQATEENFKANASKFRYLHVSTHGFMNEQNPRFSGLAFSQPKDSTSAEDGILYSAETFNLDLNADLVVLSSCESGLGKLAKGEGMLSLTRGFLYSGAKNVVVSLWKVFDEHTSKLMIEFYRGVVTGENYAGALRKAKLKMLENPETALPASWASFVLVGE